MRVNTNEHYLLHKNFDIYIPYDAEIISNQIMTSILCGKYEWREANVALQHLPVNARVLELGAGLGFISSLISLYKSPESYTAVEASPLLIEFIKKTHQKNGVYGVDVINSIVTNSNELLDKGEMRFYVDKKFCASSMSKGKNTISSYQVATQSLSNMVVEKDINVLIADIEGGEDGLFNVDVLPQLDFIMFEIHPDKLGAHKIKGIFDSLSKHGYYYDPVASSGKVLVFRPVGI